MIISESGKELMLKNIVGKQYSYNNVLRLYTNESISDNPLLEDLTECSSEGYSPLLLGTSNWTIINNVIIYPDITFNINEEDTISGYYLTQNNTLLFVYPFSEKIEISTDGGQVLISLRIGFL